MFALSTAWNADRGPNGTALAEEIEGLGFRGIELNFSLTQDTVNEIFFYARRRGLTITSAHNYCPFPEEFPRHEALPDCFSLSSPDETERQKAVHYTRRTLRTARDVGARAVVLHCGRVEMADRTRELIDLCRRGLFRSPGYQDIFGSFVEERRRLAGPFLEAILKSLEELSGSARDLGLFLGIENRFYYREIPSFDEFGVIFERFKGDPSVRYWHDVGHAYVFERLGFNPEDALLKTYGGHLGGLHIHNIRDLDDHQAPTDGDFDILKLKPFIRTDTINVVEASRRVPADRILHAKKFLEATFR